MTGRTTRLILEALTLLSRGRDVVIVAFPAAEAYRIADETAHYAQEFGIPAKLSEDNIGERTDDTPLIMIRPFGWEPNPLTYRRGQTQPTALYDHSAQHERTNYAPPTWRTVHT